MRNTLQCATREGTIDIDFNFIDLTLSIQLFVSMVIRD